MMTRLEKLQELEITLHDAIEQSSKIDPKSLASLARQYRETIKEIEEIEGVEESDEISDLINGISRTNSPDLAELPDE